MYIKILYNFRTEKKKDKELKCSQEKGSISANVTKCSTSLIAMLRACGIQILLGTEHTFVQKRNSNMRSRNRVEKICERGRELSISLSLGRAWRGPWSNVQLVQLLRESHVRQKHAEAQHRHGKNADAKEKALRLSCPACTVRNQGN